MDPVGKLTPFSRCNLQTRMKLLSRVFAVLVRGGNIIIIVVLRCSVRVGSWSPGKGREDMEMDEQPLVMMVV